MVDSGLRFTQINLQHCAAASAVISRQLSKLHTHILLIQEPWTYKGLIKGIDNKVGTAFYCTEDQRPRACIYVAKHINAAVVPNFCFRDLVAVLIRYTVAGEEREVIVCSAYLPYDSPTPPPSEELVALIEYCRVKGLGLIVGCDANSHHTIWGSTDINRRGQALLEYLSTTDLEILNRGSRPTFVTNRRRETLDITLSSFSLTRDIVD